LLAKCSRGFGCLSAGFFVAIVVLSAACVADGYSVAAPPSVNSERGGSMERSFDGRLFDQGSLKFPERNACSPASPGPKWRGVLIQAPARATLPLSADKKDARGIPVCGLYALDIAAIAKSPALILVAVDMQRGETFKGSVVDNDPSLEV